MSPKDLKLALAAAKASSQIIRVYRDGLDDGWASGFVVALGDEFFAIELIDKAQRLDGFNCLRYRDISDCAPEPHVDFFKKALKARGEVRSDFAVDVASLPVLLRSVANAFPLVTIFYEGDESYCHIGKVSRVTDFEVHLLEISPDARWDNVPTPHALVGITRVDFGGAYEASLHLVAASN